MDESSSKEEGRSLYQSTITDSTRRKKHHSIASIERRKSVLEEEQKVGSGCSVVASFPPAVWFIFGNEFCERFSYYGMKAILVLYMTDVLLWPDERATLVYHTFVCAAYFMPIIGAIVADTFWGKFKTIVVFSIILASGHIVKSVASIPIKEQEMWYLSILGLILIAVGVGGIKPCVSSFGGDQIPPDEIQMREVFYQTFYFSVNVGSFMSIIITPILREDVQCFGRDCYPLAFGLPAALFALSILVFLLGTPLYNRVPPEGSVVTSALTATKAALINRIKEGGGQEECLMYYAHPEFDKDFLDDIQQFYKMCVVFIPIPFFWMGFDQQGSTWTLQAKQMDGRFGFITIHPDQVQAINPIMILILIPVMSNLVYPVLNKLHLLRTHLQKIGCGMVLAAASFLIAAFLQIAINDNLPFQPLNSDQSSMWLINQSPCLINSSISHSDHLTYFTLDTEGGISRTSYSSSDDISVSSELFECVETDSPIANFTWDNSEDGDSYFTFYYLQDSQLAHSTFKGSEQSPGDADCRFSFFNSANKTAKFHVTSNDKTWDIPVGGLEFSKNHYFDTGEYTVTADLEGTPPLTSNVTIDALFGGVYIFSVGQTESPDEWVVTASVVSSFERVNIGWQVPQYVVVTVGEIMVSVTGLDFAYSEVSPHLKALMQSMWLMTVALGNILDIFLIGAIFPPSMVVQFIICAGLMLASSGVFMAIASCYTYADPLEDEQYIELTGSTFATDQLPSYGSDRT